MKKLVLSFIICVSLVSSLFGQSGIRDSVIKFPMLSLGYGVYFPEGDLKDRFGTNSMISLGFTIKNAHNYLFGFTSGFIFGDRVEEEGLFTGLENSAGQIIGLDGLYADVRVFERGYQVALQFGKVFSLGNPNPNSGIVFTAGPGFIQHKIRIETIGNTVPALRDEYKKGYDRLSNGFELNEFLGYMHFSNKQLFNFYAGFEFIQAFTENRRDHNFNAPEEDGAKYTDFLSGIKLGWVLPLYKKKPAAYYFY